MDLGALLLVGGEGDGVQQEQLLDAAFVDAVEGGAGEHAVGRAGVDLLGAADLLDGPGRTAEGAGRVHDVVQQDAGLAGDVADDVHDLGLVGALTALVHDGHVDAELHGEGTGAGGAAHIGGDDHDLLVAFAELICKIGDCKKFHLRTKPCDTVEETGEMQKALDEIKNAMADQGVEMDYVFTNVIHDRYIKLSNGWEITPGRGLHIFQKAESKYYGMGTYDQTLRPCQECKIEIKKV